MPEPLITLRVLFCFAVIRSPITAKHFSNGVFREFSTDFCHFLISLRSVLARFPTSRLCGGLFHSWIIVHIMQRTRRSIVGFSVACLLTVLIASSATYHKTFIAKIDCRLIMKRRSSFNSHAKCLCSRRYRACHSTALSVDYQSHEERIYGAAINFPTK